MSLSRGCATGPLSGAEFCRNRCQGGLLHNTQKTNTRVALQAFSARLVRWARDDVQASERARCNYKASWSSEDDAAEARTPLPALGRVSE